MNSGRDPDASQDPGRRPIRRWTLWQACWFRVVVVYAMVALMSGTLVPHVLRQATEREEAKGLLVWVDDPDGDTPSGRWAQGPAITRVAASSKATVSGKATSETAAGTGNVADLYWVQVGVFRDAEAATRVAQRLRERKYRVQESIVPNRDSPATPTESSGGGAGATRARGARYEVVVSGGASSEVAAKVTAKGLAGRSSTEGVVITPSLPLSEAVALSKDLADDGLAVRVRRVGAPASPAPSAGAPPAAVASSTLHRVRVGGFVDRTAAQAALQELEALGYKPFLVRGSE